MPCGCARVAVQGAGRRVLAETWSRVFDVCWRVAVCRTCTSEWQLTLDECLFFEHTPKTATIMTKIPGDLFEFDQEVRYAEGTAQGLGT